MITHRYHLPYYQQVAVFFWPILFFELWRVDRWQDQTGRRAFVTPDKYGRAWVPWFEGMSQKPHLQGVETRIYAPNDVDQLCPGWLGRATSQPEIADARGDLQRNVSLIAARISIRGIPVWGGIDEETAHLDPG